MTDEERLKRLRKVLVGGRSTNPSALQKFIDQLEAEERNKNDNTDENLSISIKTVISCVENEVKSIDWANVKCEIDVDPVEKDVRSIIDSQLTSSDDSDNFFEKFMKELAQDNAKDTNISSVFQCKALEEFLTNDKSFGEESKVGDIKVENSSKEVRTSQRKKRVRTAFTGDADVIHKPKRRRKIPFEPSYMLPTPIPQEISPKIAIFSGGQKRKRRAKSPVFPVSNHLGKNMVKSELAVPGKRTIRPPKRFADYTTDLTDMVEQPKLGRPKKKQNSKEKLVYVKMDETIKTELDSTESPTCSSADQSSFEADQLITIKLEPIEDDVTPPLNPLLSVIRHDHNYRLKGAEVKKMPISRVLQIFKAMVTNKQISAELASHFFSAVRIQQQNLAVKKIVAEGWNEDDETPHFFDTVNPTKVSAMEFLQKVCPEMVMNVPTPLLIKQVRI